MSKRPDARTMADYRHPTLAHQLDNRAILRNPATWPVEDSIAQGEGLHIRALLHSILEIPNCRQSLAEAGWRIRIEWIIFGFNRPAFTRERPPTEALRNEPACAHLARCGHKDVGDFSTKAVGQGE